MKHKSILLYSDNLIALEKLKCTHKEQIDLVYIDPPYNTNQVFTVSKNRASTISRESNGELAYSDNMSFEMYLEYIRQVIEKIHPLMSEKGTIYVHINVKVSHYIKIILDEVFGMDHFMNDISRIKSNPKNSKRRAFGNQKDVILVYSKGEKPIWNDVRMPIDEGDKKRFPKEDKKGRYNTTPCHAPGETQFGETGKPWRGMLPPHGRHWRIPPKELDILDEQGLIEWSNKGNPRIKKYLNDFQGKRYQDVWIFKDPQYPSYPTEKNEEMLDLIIKQSSDTTSIVLDCFAGSGTTLLSAAELGRTFIGVDASNIAIQTAQEKLKGHHFEFVSLKDNRMYDKFLLEAISEINKKNTVGAYY